MPVDLTAPASRRFARFRQGAAPEHPGSSAVPDDGMCLSAFLLLRPTGHGGEVLMGRINPEAPWERLGALDPARVAQIGHRWMLPSSQLLLFESPTEAVRRIVHEQLGTALPDLRGPAVFSESYRRNDPAKADPHWDLHFVFEGRWPETRFPRSRAFTELAFVDVARTPRSEIARAQADVLELVGLSSAP
jgi:hypothetical protein